MFTLPPLRYIISKRRFFSVEKSIKLVAFDMDGTVLDSKLRLPKGLFEMIESHPNVKFVVASGRQYYRKRTRLFILCPFLTLRHWKYLIW